MEFHEAATIFPMMNADEYAALKADIAEHGQQEPIYTYQGKIIDGRNRWNACRELGITPRLQAWEGDGSPVMFVVSLNLHRRHLTSSQRSVVALAIEEQLAVEAKARMRAGGIARQQGNQKIDYPETEKGQAAEQAARIAGTNRQYVSDAKKLAQETPELIAPVHNGAMSIPEAKKVAALPEADRAPVIEKVTGGAAPNVKAAIKQHRQEKRARTRAHAADLVTPDNITLIHADMRGWSPDDDAGAVDLILTDPPYSRDHLPLYRDLACFAARTLKPGGSLLVMCGQSYLDDILEIMRACETPAAGDRRPDSIAYHWTLAYLTPGGQSPQIWPRKVNTFWKPILWFVKGVYAGGWHGDVIRSDVNDNDKRFHAWGQSESGVARLVETFTAPGDLIVDPFLGGGTTAVVAYRLGRRCIGLDIDAACIETASLRLVEGAA